MDKTFAFGKKSVMAALCHDVKNIDLGAADDLTDEDEDDDE